MLAESTGLVLKALKFAAHKHRHQRRKDAAQTPYINHPIALAELLWNQGKVYDPVVIAGALLHDTVEDTETSFSELESEFGVEVANLVREVTDDKSLSHEIRKQRQVDHAPFLSDRARLVKLADKICNLHDVTSAPPPSWSLDRRRHYVEWSNHVINQIRGSHPGLEQQFDQLYHQGMTLFAECREIDNPTH